MVDVICNLKGIKMRMWKIEKNNNNMGNKGPQSQQVIMFITRFTSVL